MSFPVLASTIFLSLFFTSNVSYLLYAAEQNYYQFLEDSWPSHNHVFYSLERCPPTVVPGSSNISITLEFVRNVNSSVTPKTSWIKNSGIGAQQAGLQRASRLFWRWSWRTGALEHLILCQTYGKHSVNICRMNTWIMYGWKMLTERMNPQTKSKWIICLNLNVVQVSLIYKTNVMMPIIHTTKWFFSLPKVSSES